LLEPLAVTLVGPLDVGGDEHLLRGEQSVERRGRDTGFSGHAIDPGRSNAVPIEEPLSDVEHVLSRLVRAATHFLVIGLHGRADSTSLAFVRDRFNRFVQALDGSLREP